MSGGTTKEEEELELKVKELQSDLKKWKDKYEEAHKERLELEAQVKALESQHQGQEQEQETSTDETSPQAQPQPQQAPPSRPPPAAPVASTPSDSPQQPNTDEAAPAAAPPSRAAPPTPVRRVVKPPIPGGGSGGPLGGVQIPVLDRSKKDLTEIDEDILSKPYLKKLYLFQNLIEEIPSGISRLGELQLLDLKYNRLKALPDEFCQLKALTEVTLTGNTIQTLPAHFDGSSLSNLSKLDLTQNRVEEFPQSLLTLTSLTELGLERNRLSALPEGLSQLVNLKKLTLKDNRLKALPASLGSMPALEHLQLGDNELESLPEEVGGLVNLVTLDLSNNALEALPESVGQWTALTTLSLKRNRLTALPESIQVTEETGWYSLYDPNLFGNRLTELPAGLWTLEAMQSLNLTSNRLTELPADIANLYGLTSLRVGDNQLTKLPEELAHLESLQTLEAFCNQLTEVPEQLGQLYNLEVLFLAYNKIKALPDLSALEQLRELFISGNPLGDEGFHPSVWTLANLHLLFAHNVQLSTLPEDLSALVNLEVLDLSANKLESIPGAALTNLEMLARWNLSHNLLTTMPDELMDVRELEELDLTANRFTTMPPVLDYIKERVDILLDLNPLEGDAAKQHDENPHAWKRSARFTFDCAEMLGRRPTMEDAFSIQGRFGGKEDVDYFGLYDGHAGRIAATFAGEHLHQILSAKLSNDGVNVEQALQESFREVNDKFKEFLDGADHSYRHAGSTGVLVLFIGNKCYVANVGDSRAVLARGSKAQRLSFDHKPYSEEEEDRIRSLGGYVTGDTGRVNGLLAVSRSIGDFYMQPFVIVDPFVDSTEIGEEDELLILACDGVWDEVSDEQAVAIVRTETDPFLMSAKLRDYAYLLGSDDNISATVVLLKKKPQ
ncbi:PPM-type phosphatase domain-containing protein [Balamuthia mandrillaris]